MAAKYITLSYDRYQSLIRNQEVKKKEAADTTKRTQEQVPDASNRGPTIVRHSNGPINKERPPTTSTHAFQLVQPINTPTTPSPRAFQLVQKRKPPPRPPGQITRKAVTKWIKY